MANRDDRLLGTYCLVRFNRKSGKIDTSLESIGSAMLQMWALNNTTKTKDTIIFEKETGNVVFYAEGTGNFPHIFKEELGNIESYCPGLLKAMQED